MARWFGVQNRRDGEKIGILQRAPLLELVSIGKKGVHMDTQGLQSLPFSRFSKTVGYMFSDVLPLHAAQESSKRSRGGVSTKCRPNPVSWFRVMTV